MMYAQVILQSSLVKWGDAKVTGVSSSCGAPSGLDHLVPIKLHVIQSAVGSLDARRLANTNSQITIAAIKDVRFKVNLNAFE